MANGHKVRLGEGSEVTLSRKELRDWFDKGLIHADSPVQAPGSAQWKRLDQILDVARKRAPGEGAGGGPLSQITLERKHVMLLSAFLGGLVLVGAIGYFMPEIKSLLGITEDDLSIAAQASPDRRFAEPALGVSMDVPAGWSLLKPEQDLVPMPPEAQLALGHQDTGVLAYLVLESPSRGYLSLDDFLDRMVQARRRVNPSVHPTGRAEATVAGGPARRSEGSWEYDQARFHESIVVLKRGWTYAGLVAWAPEAKAAALGPASEAVLAAIAFKGPMITRLPEAVEKVSAEVPILTPETAEMLMGQSAALVLEPPDAFRRAYEAVGRGMSALTSAEIQELGALSTALYNTLPGRERQQLGSYIERVRDRQATSTAEDHAVSQLAKRAVLKLPPPRRARLQQIYTKAITAGYRGS
jgi:hypothetical protein